MPQPPITSAPARPWRDTYRDPILYALLALLLYSANGRVIGSGDSLPARFIPFAILGYGTVALDPVAAATRMGNPVPYWMQPATTGQTVSLFPITTPVLVTPLYVPAVMYLSMTEWTESRLRAMGAIMEKVSASLVAAAAVGLMFMLLRRSATHLDARLLTLAFAAGTAMWPISSQALWQHGVGQLCLIVALLAVTDPPRWSRVAMAGVAAGILAANRPLDGLFAAAIGVYACWWARGRFPVFALAAAVPVALVLWYNLWMFGHVWGGYGVTGHISVHFFEQFPHPRWQGIAGLLISPGNGLFVFSPFLLLLLCVNPFRGHARPVLALLLALAVGVQVWGYAGVDWRGGFVYGPRFLADTIPVLVWLLIGPLATLVPRRRALFMAAVACAIAVQAIGAFKFMGQSSLILHGPGQTEAYERSWRVRDSPILVEAREPFAPMTVFDEIAALRWEPPAGLATPKPD